MTLLTNMKNKLNKFQTIKLTLLLRGDSFLQHSKSPVPLISNTFKDRLYTLLLPILINLPLTHPTSSKLNECFGRAKIAALCFSYFIQLLCCVSVAIDWKLFWFSRLHSPSLNCRKQMHYFLILLDSRLHSSKEIYRSTLQLIFHLHQNAPDDW